MKVLLQTRAQNGSGGAAFTMVEVLVTVTIATVMIAAAVAFMDLASRSISGITAQSSFNDNASQATALILSRVRLANSSSTDASGNTLTLGFDDNYNADSDGDRNLYNDRDHFEIFQFVNGDGDDATLADNKLIYKPRSDLTQTNIVVASGVRRLPGWNIFTVTNIATVLLRFGLTDEFARDGYQACDIQTALVPRNRPVATNMITILP